MQGHGIQVCDKIKARKTAKKELFKMPWKDKTVKELREEFALQAQECKNFSKLCREYGITRRTGYKWLARDDKSNISRKPKTSPRKTDESTEKAILQVREENPAWGGKTIRKILENQGYKNLPCVKTCNNILKRNNCITPEASLAATAYIRFEKEKCNEMWQTDFKGDFLLKDNTRCYPLDILDDHSRFVIRIDAKPNTLGVMDSFKQAFLSYGMPSSILSDNGWTFRGLHGGYTTFERWLMEHDVLPIHGRVKHPQTQGKIERFHRTMKKELLNGNSFSNLKEAQIALNNWKDKYNNIRPHHALNMKCPSDIYRPSVREYCENISKYEYGGEHHVLKVNSWGYLRFDKFQVYLSETMIDKHIEMRQNPNDDTFFACYRNFKIAEFSAIDGHRINRKISRLFNL